MTHTPTPWRREHRNNLPTGNLLGEDGTSVIDNSPALRTAFSENRWSISPLDADLIVRAVNSYDALVSALEAVRDSGMFDWEGGVAYEAEAKQVADALALAQEVRE